MSYQDPSSRPDLVSGMRIRVPLPLVVPLAAVAVIALVTIGFSRILLGVTAEAATTIALVTAANILVACSFVALRPRMHRVGVLEVALIALYPILVGVVLAFTGVGSEPEAATEAGPAETQAAPEQPQTASGDQIALTAANISFDTDRIELPAKTDVSVTLDNQDTAPHNFAIYRNEEDAGSQSNPLFQGDNVDPQASETYEFKSPPKGNYFFHCDIHPTMNGEAIVS
jgi:plastocyanin